MKVCPQKARIVQLSTGQKSHYPPAIHHAIHLYNVLFPGHNHLLTTNYHRCWRSGDDQSIRSFSFPSTPPPPSPPAPSSDLIILGYKIYRLMLTKIIEK